MKIKSLIYTALLSAVAVTSTATAEAKMVDILGITNDGQRARIKAKLNLEDKRVSGVTSYSYNMTDGYANTNTNYDIVQEGEDTYLSVDVTYYPDDDGYTYRVVLTFSDGTTYTSEVVNEDLTEAFMWLGDYGAPGTSGWNSPVVDKEVDSSLTFWLDGIHYYKCVSNHAPGSLLYTFPDAQFSSFYTKYGVQDDREEGDVMFKFFTGNDVTRTSEAQLTPVGNQLMYAKSNPNRPADLSPVSEITIPMEGVKVLRLSADQWDSNNWGDHANYAMPRLYLPVSHTKKQTQTVDFHTEGNIVLEGETKLTASASSGGKVYYSVISGRNLASIEGDVLKPVWGGKGTVVVEATQYGDDNYYPATAYLTFDVEMQPDIEILDAYHPTVSTNDNNGYVYLFVDTKGKKLDKLDVTVFNDHNRLTQTSTINLMPKYDGDAAEQVIEFAVPGLDSQVLLVSYSYEGSDAVEKLPYWHTKGSYDYISDMPVSNLKMTVGWASPSAPNKSFNGDNGGVLSIVANPGVNYAKGLGLHARGVLELQPSVLTPYDRVAADMGAQVGYGGDPSQTMAYSVECGSQIVKTSKTLNPETGQYEGGDVPKSQYVSWDVPINNGAILRLIIDKGSDNRDDNDHVCVGAPRLYYIPLVKSPQTIDWELSRNVVSNKPVQIDLSAMSSTSLPIYYKVVKGNEFASISNGVLYINTPQNGDTEVIVDAYQPGNDVWAPAPTVSCTFRLSHGLEVQKNEYVEISGPDVLDELIVHADKNSAGQVAIKSGIVDVKKVILKYTFVPGEWAYIAFPSDLDIDKVSNLNELGYRHNAYGAPAYYIREFNTAMHENNPFGEDDWRILDEPVVEGLKGYTMSIDDRLTTEPVEVTFIIDNTKVDLKSVMSALGLTLDLSVVNPGTTIPVTIASSNPNVDSNQLTVQVQFDPADLSSLPLNHEQALERTRFVFVGNHKAIRLTLPDQTPARIAFFDKAGRKVLKAVRYIAPNVIDLSDMKTGTYNMVVSYGPAIKTYEITL